MYSFKKSCSFRFLLSRRYWSQFVRRTKVSWHRLTIIPSIALLLVFLKVIINLIDLYF